MRKFTLALRATCLWFALGGAAVYASAPTPSSDGTNVAKLSGTGADSLGFRRTN